MVKNTDMNNAQNSRTNEALSNEDLSQVAGGTIGNDYGDFPCIECGKPRWMSKASYVRDLPCCDECKERLGL